MHKPLRSIDVALLKALHLAALDSNLAEGGSSSMPDGC